MFLSQPPTATKPSNPSQATTVSIESAITSRDTREYFIPSVPIEMPSEIVIVADETANPVWVAADLLAQAEHDVEARPLLVTTSSALADDVDRELARQLTGLPREPIARDYFKVVGPSWLALVYLDRIAGTWHLERIYD